MKPVTDTALLDELEGGTKARPVADAATRAELDKPRGVGSELVRQAGLTARAGIEGVAALPGMVANAPAALANKLLTFFNPPKLGDQVTGDRGFRFADQTKAGEALADAIGLPKPENQIERVARDVASSMAGGGSVIAGGNLLSKGSSAIAKAIGETLAANPGMQTLSNATGGAAGSVAREEGAGEAGQLAATLAGTMVPAAATSGIAGAVRAAVRGGEGGRKRMLDTIQAFEDAGAGTPSVGQATEGRTARALESGLSKTPGAAGRMAAKAEVEAAGMGGKVDELAGALATRTGAAPAGREIKQGIGRFVDDFRRKSGELYDALDTHIPKDTRIDVNATQRALATLNAGIPGAPNLSRFFQNSKILGIDEALRADTLGAANVLSRMSPIERQMFENIPTAARTAMIQEFEDGKLPYEALKKLRTLVGQEISNHSLTSDVPRSKWKALYAALSDDLGTAARGAGPEAEAAFGRANKYHGAAMKRLDDVLEPIMAKGDPEDIFKAAMAGTAEGATTIRGVMKSLPEDSRKVVAATALRRLGRATAGKQDDLGEVFSSETFLTNWNKLSRDAKASLFGPLPDGMRADLDRIAKVASNMREGSKVFANPSGTAQAQANWATAGAAAMALMTGNVGTAAGIGGAVAASNIAARAMTNPVFVKWLAGSTRVPVEQLPAQLNELSQAIFRMPKDERDDAREVVRELRERLKQPAQRESL